MTSSIRGRRSRSIPRTTTSSTRAARSCCSPRSSRWPKLRGLLSRRLQESNDKKKGEGNTKNGNKYLAWAFGRRRTSRGATRRRPRASMNARSARPMASWRPRPWRTSWRGRATAWRRRAFGKLSVGCNSACVAARRPPLTVLTEFWFSRRTQRTAATKGHLPVDPKIPSGRRGSGTAARFPVMSDGSTIYTGR